MMTNTNRKIRPATTAIAAVLALSSTSLIAQTVTAPVDPAPASTAPVAPQAPIMVAPVADPLAPATPPIAETPAEATVSAEAAPARVKSTKSVAKTSVIRTAKSPSLAQTAPPVTRSAPTEVVKTAPIEPIAQATPIAAVPVAAVPPTVADVAPAPSTLKTDEVLPIAGAAGAGLLALAGIGVAVRRRKRHDYDLVVDEEPVLETSHEQIVEPTFARSPIASSPAISSQVAEDEFHDEFDLSKYGPNVQAAYRGPTADNPSLSLRKRLKRGAALDQMARSMGEAAAIDAKAPVPASAMPMTSGGSFMLRPSTVRAGFKPAFQS